ncbi:hypothetical protein [Longispora albida]|uniref:hypothetical protein n=1 Tax=Longispora albida TaxID=203523 RepID=UPI00035F15F8|nr:hypothetical protein [Longispora albida]
MDLSSFYAVVSGINFTLLGLWWVAAKDRPEMAGRDAAGRRMAYLVSLQFLVPGTMALLAQVAPTVPMVWRVTFTFAGLAGALGILLLAPALGRESGQFGVARMFQWVAVPVYVLIAAVAGLPAFANAIRGDLTALQVEAILFCVLTFLGVQAAWAVGMAPRAAEADNKEESYPGRNGRKP